MQSRTYGAIARRSTELNYFMIMAIILITQGDVMDSRAYDALAKLGYRIDDATAP